MFHLTNLGFLSCFALKCFELDSFERTMLKAFTGLSTAITWSFCIPLKFQCPLQWGNQLHNIASTAQQFLFYSPCLFHCPRLPSQVSYLVPISHYPVTIPPTTQRKVETLSQKLIPKFSLQFQAWTWTTDSLNLAICLFHKWNSMDQLYSDVVAQETFVNRYTLYPAFTWT